MSCIHIHTVTLVCDKCSKETENVSEEHPPIGWTVLENLVVTTERTHSGEIEEMGFSNYDFCSWDCLKEWISEFIQTGNGEIVKL